MDSSPVAIYKIHEHLRPKVRKRMTVLTPNWRFFIFFYFIDVWN